MNQPDENNNVSSSRHPLIAIDFAAEDLKAEAEQLASDFKMRLIDKAITSYDAILLLTKNHLELHSDHYTPTAKPIYIDFTNKTFRYRWLHGGSQMVLKALGIKKEYRPNVIDTTGGMGKDSFLIASSGCQVTIYERNPVVAALLYDGLSRAASHLDTKETARRLHLIFADATAALAKMAISGEKIDIIYLDPMFPRRSKSAKVKKELQVLQFLIGQDSDTTKLFEMAMKVATDRIVVKRPKNANTITDFRPSHKIAGKTTRFDVYMKN